MDLTCPRFNNVTIPLRRYHTPSRVRQTSSASIFPPLVNMITGLPPCRCAMPGPLVETGSDVARVCAVEIAPGELFGDGEGEGETTGDGEGIVTAGCAGAGVAAVTGACVAADVLRASWLMP